MIEVIRPNWSAPSRVKVATTTRTGGFSEGAWASFNLATHVDDDYDRVMQNRRLLAEQLILPSEPCWLTQVHGIKVIDSVAAQNEADAFYTDSAGVVAAVLTADCLPVVLTNKTGSAVAVAHAGWRGLADGVIEKTVASFPKHDPAYHAWLGPAIGPAAFEVGAEVVDAFVAQDKNALAAFVQRDQCHWLADLYQLARLRLRQLAVTNITGGDYCTFSQADQFYSYRRDGVTGRMATLAWIEV